MSVTPCLLKFVKRRGEARRMTRGCRLIDRKSLILRTGGCRKHQLGGVLTKGLTATLLMMTVLLPPIVGHASPISSAEGRSPSAGVLAVPELQLRRPAVLDALENTARKQADGADHAQQVQHLGAGDLARRKSDRLQSSAWRSPQRRPRVRQPGWNASAHSGFPMCEVVLVLRRDDMVPGWKDRSRAHGNRRETAPRGRHLVDPR